MLFFAFFRVSFLDLSRLVSHSFWFLFQTVEFSGRSCFFLGENSSLVRDKNFSALLDKTLTKATMTANQKGDLKLIRHRDISDFQRIFKRKRYSSRLPCAEGISNRQEEKKKKKNNTQSVG